MEKKDSRPDDGASPSSVELDLGNGIRAVIRWSQMTDEQEQRFLTELRCVASYLIRLERGQGKDANGEKPEQPD